MSDVYDVLEFHAVCAYEHGKTHAEEKEDIDIELTAIRHANFIGEMLLVHGVDISCVRKVIVVYIDNMMKGYNDVKKGVVLLS